jgi:hypothetical protein
MTCNEKCQEDYLCEFFAVSSPESDPPSICMLYDAGACTESTVVGTTLYSKTNFRESPRIITDVCTHFSVLNSDSKKVSQCKEQDTLDKCRKLGNYYESSETYEDNGVTKTISFVNARCGDSTSPERELDFDMWNRRKVVDLSGEAGGYTAENC